MNHENRNFGANKAYIALGANLAYAGIAPVDTLLSALAALPAAGARVRARSQFWQSPAWPDPQEPPFANVVALVKTRLAPLALLRALRAVERRHGRERHRRNAPRTLDLDLLSYGQIVMQERRLTLPHPRMDQRAFVLLPLQEVCPRWRHPLSGKRLKTLIAALPAEARRSTRPFEPPELPGGLRKPRI